MVWSRVHRMKSVGGDFPCPQSTSPAIHWNKKVGKPRITGIHGFQKGGGKAISPRRHKGTEGFKSRKTRKTRKRMRDGWRMAPQRRQAPPERGSVTRSASPCPPASKTNHRPKRPGPLSAIALNGGEGRGEVVLLKMSGHTNRSSHGQGAGEHAQPIDCKHYL